MQVNSQSRNPIQNSTTTQTYTLCFTHSVQHDPTTHNRRIGEHTFRIPYKQIRHVHARSVGRLARVLCPVRIASVRRRVRKPTEITWYSADSMQQLAVVSSTVPPTPTFPPGGGGRKRTQRVGFVARAPASERTSVVHYDNKCVVFIIIIAVSVQNTHARTYTYT